MRFLGSDYNILVKYEVKKSDTDGNFQCLEDAELEKMTSDDAKLVNMTYMISFDRNPKQKKRIE